MTFEDYYAEHFSENLKGGLYLEFKRTWEAAQKAERERIKRIVQEVGRQGNHDAWFDCCDTIMERIG